MRKISALFLPLVLATPTPVLARDAVSRFIPLGPEIEAPGGYVEMCAQDSALCRRFRPALSAPTPSAIQPFAPFASLTSAATPTPPAPLSLPSLALPVLDRFAAPRLAAPYHFSLAMPAALAQTAPDLASNGLTLVASPTLTATLAPHAAPSLALGNQLGRLPAPLPVSRAPASPLSSERLALLRQPTAAILRPPLPEAPDGQREPTGAPDEKALMKLLKAVNTHVNHRVFQQTDLKLYGRAEVWRPSGDGRNAVGDCEDLALEKRVQLINADFPRDRLFMAVVYSRSAGLHAVLLARMADGDLVLDSRAGYISRWADTDYEWLSIESAQDPDRWFAPA